MDFNDDIENRLLRWHPHLDVQGYATLAEFHEWNVEFALAKFRAKISNDEPVTFFTFRRLNAGISIVETQYASAREKYAIQQTMREACRIDLNVMMISSICECWIAASVQKADGTFEDLIERYKEVRHVPGREDGLMVATFARDGSMKMTRWVVKLKHNPANNRILARDDMVREDGTEFYGANFGFFEPERPYPRGEIKRAAPSTPPKPRPAPKPEPAPTEESVIILGPPKKENGNGNT